ncbi:MAG: FtsW/RodA/SpoVE family cell cycle protein [Clostridia bacterium]|nr:FtsW/RodA/SpoVE family cell cycle protein [Clostridia bacterium]
MQEISRRSRAHFDWPLVLAVYAMIAFGIVCIASSLMDPDLGTDRSLLSYILDNRSSLMQSIFALLSPIALAVVVAIPMELYRGRIGDLIYYGVLVLLVLTLFLSTAVNNINAWLQGPFGRAFQPCEFAKISIILILAKQLSRSSKPMGTFKDFMRVCVSVGVPAVTVLAQGETGSVIVIGVAFLVMIYFAGVDLRIIFGMIAAVLLAAVALVAFALISGSTDYRLARILAFVDPESYSQGSGYQSLQAAVAIGSGQKTGLGLFRLGTHTQLGNVPEHSTDFILATIGEGFGFTGIIAVLLMYAFIVFRLLYLANNTQDKFGKLIIIGVMAMLFFHVIQNMGMCLGLLPITGIPLPFLSYGGTNLLTNIIGIGLALNVTRSRTAAQVMPLGQLGMR